MGLKDHLEDGTGHILSPGLDLDYLHVEGAERQAGNLGAGATVKSSNTAGSRSISCSIHSSSSSSCSNFSEESAISDSEDERLQTGSGSEFKTLHHDQPHLHQRESSSVCQPVRLDLTPNQSPGHPSETALTDPITDCRTKVEFALKLGYSEELVLLVLRKLGPDALINDILGELVKLGTKTEMDQQGGPTVSQSASSSLSSTAASSSSSSSLDSSQLLCPSHLLEDKENLRPVVVDGSNVAMSHGNKEVFSCQGIQLAVDWFLERGHRDITVFVPAWRKEQSRPDALITDQEILRRLEKEKILVFTPSRRVQGRRVVCYDDRFIVKLAYESDGIIVSNDNYRDLANEKPEWKKFIDERLLMYSFVNDKFMPPDDPLGRHGPSLENFLRKRPVIPEHRKQPCPYGKKCTYGHKCKFYHPERGSQPQRAVADELRASAKISSVSSRGLLEHALKAKSQKNGQLEGMAEAQPNRDTGKNKPNQSPNWSSFSEHMEDKFQVYSKAEEKRGGSSSSNIVGHPAPGGPPSSGHLERWEHPEGSSGGSSSVVEASGSRKTESYHRCSSPEVGYNSLVKAYSGLSLVVPQTPERFFTGDLRTSSLASDCSSEGSVSSGSFSPDPVLDDSPKCHHHHPRHHHHHYSGQYPHQASLVSPRLSQHSPRGHVLPQGLWRPHGFGIEELPPSITSHPSPHCVKARSVYIPPQQHVQLLGNCPGGPSRPQHPPQTPTAHSHSQSFPHSHNPMGSLWQEHRLQDIRVCEGSPIHSRINYSGLNQQPQHQMNWDSNYEPPPKPSYDLFSSKSLPQVHGKTWHSPWGQQVHSSPHGLLISGLPSFPQQSLPPAPIHNSHMPSASHHPKPTVLGQYQDLRERVFVNLCGIFPPDLVRMVMTRNPHVTDAQELAAAILMEKSQHSS